MKKSHLPTPGGGPGRWKKSHLPTPGGGPGSQPASQPTSQTASQPASRPASQPASLPAQAAADSSRWCQLQATSAQAGGGSSSSRWQQGGGVVKGNSVRGALPVVILFVGPSLCSWNPRGSPRGLLLGFQTEIHFKPRASPQAELRPGRLPTSRFTTREAPHKQIYDQGGSPRRTWFDPQSKVVLQRGQKQGGSPQADLLPWCPPGAPQTTIEYNRKQ